MASHTRFSLCFVPRKGNCAADFLASAVYKEVYPIGWVETPTPLLSSILVAEALITDAPQDSSLNLSPRDGVG